jgi:hypothetical protein
MNYKPVEIVKASFNFPKGELEELKALAARRSVPVTQVLRQAVAAELFLQQQVDEGKKVIVEDEDGRQMQIVFHPSPAARAVAARSATTA